MSGSFEAEIEATRTPLEGVYRYAAQIASTTYIGSTLVTNSSAIVNLILASDGNTLWITRPHMALSFRRTYPASFGTTPILDTIDTNPEHPATLSAELIWALSLISAEGLVELLTVEA